MKSRNILRLFIQIIEDFTMNSPVRQPPRQSIQSLIDYEQALNNTLMSKPAGKTSGLDNGCDGSNQQNSWESIQKLIEQAEGELAKIKEKPSLYRNFKIQFEIEQVRGQINREKINKMRLQTKLKRRKQSQERELAKLQVLLAELESVQKTANLIEAQQGQPNNLQPSDEKMVGEIEYPELGGLFQNFPAQQKTKFLERWNNQDQSKKSQALEFFNKISSRVIETDQQISFLLSKKHEEESCLQSLNQQLRDLNRESEAIGSRLQQLLKQIVEGEGEQKNLEQQLKLINNPAYLEEELQHRAQMQNKIEDKECRKMEMSIKKIMKLIQLSGDESAINDARNIAKLINLNN